MLIFVFLVPKVQFKEGSYKVDESDGEVRVTVYRSGDISLRSTVRCYTRQGSAQVMMDYSERPNTEASIITFLPGQTSFNSSCLCPCPNSSFVVSSRLLYSLLPTFTLKVSLKSHVW